MGTHCQSCLMFGAGVSHAWKTSMAEKHGREAWKMSIENGVLIAVSLVHGRETLSEGAVSGMVPQVYIILLCLM